ncbi:hypothetical protein Q1M63_31560 [Sinorhizobium meliloti]|nr:hypothetical protein Q1M63_31560 [Sinorhizobium meliloti]
MTLARIAETARATRFPIAPQPIIPTVRSAISLPRERGPAAGADAGRFGWNVTQGGKDKPDCKFRHADGVGPPRP